MTDKDLKKLNRSDLLEILLEQSRKIDELTAENEKLRSELGDRKILLGRAGSIAEAALKLNGVFEAAQNAAGQYLENIRRLDAEHGAYVETQRRRVEENAERSAGIIREAERKAAAILTEAEKKAAGLVGAEEAGKIAAPADAAGNSGGDKA